MNNDHFFSFLQGALIATFTAVAAYFDNTITFMIALVLAFLFNILAGFRADEVKIKIVRIIPPKLLQNFQGNKFKDSLMELFLIVCVTYLLKGIMDLMKQPDSSIYAVQILTWIALYAYFRNGLRNLVKVYPKNKWIRIVYHLIAFKFRELAGSDISDIVEKVEKEMEAKNELK